MKKAQMKKAQLQISFHLIFVLIGGILFFTFFLLVLKSMLGSSEAHDTRALTNGINAIIYNALPNTGSFDVARIPSGTQLYYDCKLYSPNPANPDAKVVDTSFIGVNSELPEDLVSDTAFRNTPLFMPSVFKGDKIFTKTYAWQAPMKVTNLVVATNNRTKYYIQNHQLIQEFEDDLPPVTTEYFSQNERIEKEGYDSVRIILFNQEPSEVKSFVEVDPEKVSYLKFSGNSFDSYTLDFYDGNGIKQNLATNTYYGKEVFLAAIFQDDYGKFECDYHKLLDRYKLAKEIIKKRTNSLSGNSDVSDDCKTIYETVLNKFDSELDFGQLYSDLKNTNRQLLRRDCPLIY